ncbi:FitA-like ribbon-helix-helix domain-containing protein [Klebsiella pneumoniae]|uniref:FitA-like ribbon-helix-helix domain-containing protein n=1 Tax=Klebsiella pneumoniae TaxID=573 RepID=UPI003C6D32F1
MSSLRTCSCWYQCLHDGLVLRLRELAAAHGRSAEAEHLEILAKALGGTKRKSFAEVLMSTPNVR